MDSPTACATICAIPTADESNHSPAGMLHPPYTDGHSTTAYIASHDKNTLNSNLADIYRKKPSSTSYHPSATKVICEELHSQPSWKNGLALFVCCITTTLHSCY